MAGRAVWRDTQPSRGFKVDTWAKVRAIHAEWQLTEPELRIVDTASRLLAYGIQHADAARSVQSSEEEE